MVVTQCWAQVLACLSPCLPAPNAQSACLKCLQLGRTAAKGGKDKDDAAVSG